jgi:hypothetical protein
MLFYYGYYEDGTPITVFEHIRENLEEFCDQYISDVSVYLFNLISFGILYLHAYMDLKTHHVRLCPWWLLLPTCDTQYQENMTQLVTVQKYCKKKIRYWRFKKWINTEEFAQWFYHYNNMGGYKHKQYMMSIYSPTGRRNQCT